MIKQKYVAGKTNKQKSVQHLLVSAASARAHVPIHLEIGVKLSVVALIFS